MELILDKVSASLIAGFLDSTFLPWVDSEYPKLMASVSLPGSSPTSLSSWPGLRFRGWTRNAACDCASTLRPLNFTPSRGSYCASRPLLAHRPCNWPRTARPPSLATWRYQLHPAGRRSQRLKVLVAVADPKNLLSDFGLVDIDRDQELAALREATTDLPVELVPLSGPCTLAALEAALRHDFHVLHFIGHGVYDTGIGAALVLGQ